MSGLGLCLSKGDLPDLVELARLGMHHPDRWARLFAGTNGGTVDDLVDMIRALPKRTNVLATINAEYSVLVDGQRVRVGNSLRNYAAITREAAEKLEPLRDGRQIAVCVLNEPDIWHHQPPIGERDRELTPEFAAEFCKVAYPILSPRGIKVVLPSVASAVWPEYLRRMAKAARGCFDWADLHLYVKDAGGVPGVPGWQTVERALVEAHVIVNAAVGWPVPVIASEGGVKPIDMGGLEQHAAWVRNYLGIALNLPETMYPVLCLFAWANSAGSADEQDMSGFGLRDGEKRARPAWYAFAEVAAGVEPAPIAPIAPPAPAGAPRFLEGFGRWKALEPELLGEPIEDESGPIEGISAQRTTTGLLFWANVPAGVGSLVFIASDGRRRVWREDWPASREAA